MNSYTTFPVAGPLRTCRNLSLACLAALSMLAACKKKDETPSNYVTIAGETSALDFLGDQSAGSYAINNSTYSLDNGAYAIVYFNGYANAPSSGTYPVAAYLNSPDSVWISVANAAGTRYQSKAGGSVTVSRSGGRVTASFDDLSFYGPNGGAKVSARVSNQ